MDIENEVIDILADQLGVEKEKIKSDSKIIEDLGADSLDTVEIIQVIEEKFDIKITDEDTEKLLTVQDVIKYLKSKLNK